MSYFNGTQKTALGLCNITLTNPGNGRSYQQLFEVVKFGNLFLLGVQADQEVDLLMVNHKNIFSATVNPSTTQHRETSGAELISRFPRVFNRELGVLEGELHLEGTPHSTSSGACQKSASGYKERP